MDFIVRLPLTSRKLNSIWVIVDQLTKSAHSIPVYTFYRAEKYDELYVSRILCLHGVPKTIISDRGPSLSLASGSSCMLPWGRVGSTAWLIIHRPMVRHRG
jgi:hypothetical protein